MIVIIIVIAIIIIIIINNHNIIIITIIIWEIGGIRLETLSRFLGSKQPIAGLSLLVYAWSTEGYCFTQFEISNSTSSTVFRQHRVRTTTC